MKMMSNDEKIENPYLLKPKIKGGLINIAGFIKGLIGTSIYLPIYIAVLMPLINSLVQLLAGKVVYRSLLSVEMCSTDPLTFFSLHTPLGMVVLISVFFLAIVYFLSKIFQHEALSVFVKTELLDLFLTIVLVSVIALIIYLPCNIHVDIKDLGFSQSYSLDLYDAAYLSIQIGELSSMFLLHLADFIYVITFFFTSFVIAQNVFGGLALQTFSGVSLTLKPALGMMLMGAAVNYIGYVIQKILFEFITYGTIKYLLPIGFLLRAFTPTKKVGGVVLGFTLAGPILYTLVVLVTYQPIMDRLPFTLHSIAPNTPTSYKIFFVGIVPTISSLLHGLLDKFSFAEKKVLDIAQQQPSTAEEATPYKRLESTSTEFYGSAGGILNKVYKFILNLCAPIIILAVLPVLNFIIMITGVRYLGRFFGEDIDISNLTRVI